MMGGNDHQSVRQCIVLRVLRILRGGFVGDVFMKAGTGSAAALVCRWRGAWHLLQFRLAFSENQRVLAAKGLVDNNDEVDLISQIRSIATNLRGVNGEPV